MFTGIIEQQAQLVGIEIEGTNHHFTFKSPMSEALKIDQSLAHNGCCLTVVEVNVEKEWYKVTAIQETLEKTNLGSWSLGTWVNIERCMEMTARVDGHIVQGHVDQIGVCESIEELNGSWKFYFTYTGDNITVEKGSIAVNGVSLTVVDAQPNKFSVCIIPYTFLHTHFKDLKINDTVNLEFDIIGKYVKQYMKVYGN